MAGFGKRLLTEGLFGNHRTFILGVLASVVGITGSIGGFSAGAGIAEIALLALIGIAGLALVVGYVIFYSQREGRRSR